MHGLHHCNACHLIAEENLFSHEEEDKEPESLPENERQCRHHDDAPIGLTHPKWGIVHSEHPSTGISRKLGLLLARSRFASASIWPSHVPFPPLFGATHCAGS